MFGVDSAVMMERRHKFFVSTQDRGCPSASTEAQLSAVRSHLATQQHARRRQRVQTANANRLNQPYGKLNQTDQATQSRGWIDAGQVMPQDSMHQDHINWNKPSNLGVDSLSPQSLHSDVRKARAVLDLTFTGISSMLISFPIGLTTEEKYSLHFYLTFGRQKLLGTTKNVKYCPIADLAQSLMSVCPIYVLAHIVLGELLLSEYLRRSVRPYYYARFAQMYTAVSSTLASPEATFCHKLWAIIQVAMVESTARRHDISKIHNRALDDFFESRDGFVASIDAQADDIYAQISSRLYAGLLARNVMIDPDVCHFNIVKDRFMFALYEIQDRVDLLRFDFMSQNVNLDTVPPQLDQLKIYLDLLTQNSRHGRALEASYEYELGALFCLLSVVRTFVECPCSQETILEFLHQVQGYFNDSTYQTDPGANALHPAATAYGISCVRSEVFPRNHLETEFRISRTLVDAHRVFFLAGSTARAELITWLGACVATMAYQAGRGTEFEDESDKVRGFEAQKLSNDLELSWRMRNS